MAAAPEPGACRSGDQVKRSGRELIPGFIKLVRSPLTLLISVRSFRFGRVSPPLRREENRDRAGAYRPPGSLIYRLVLPVQGLALVW